MTKYNKRFQSRIFLGKTIRNFFKENFGWVESEKSGRLLHNIPLLWKGLAENHVFWYKI